MSGKNVSKTALVLSIIIATSSSALAGIVSFEAYPGTPPAPQAVTFAQSDPRFDTAVSIWVRRGADWTRGSGTVVGSNKVDTVGHLFAAAWDEIRVYTGHDIGSFQQLTYGSSVEFYDGWNPNVPLHLANDGATLYTTEPMVGITPAVPYLGTIPVGTQAEIVGYGSYGYVGAGPLGIDFHRRAGTTRIDYIDIFSGTESFTSLFRAPDDALSSPLTMRGSYGLSGGSIWGLIEDEWRFIGHEFASDTIYGYGSATYSIRVVPEPTALTLLATGLLLVVRKRLQRRGKSIVNERHAGISVPIDIVLMGAVVVSFCGAPQLRAGTIRHDMLDSQYTNRAMQMPFALAQGGLAIKYQGESFYRLQGGAVLVNHSYVLSTRHQYTGTGAPITDVQFRLGYDVVNPLETIAVVNWVSHPLYNPNDAAGYGYDLAIAKLASAATVADPIEIFDGAVAPEMHMELLGFGRHGTGFTGGIDFDGLMRSWEDDLLGLSGDPNDPFHLVGPHHAFFEFNTPAFGAWPFEGASAIVDSGSLVAVNNNGTWQLAGLQDSSTGNGFYADFSIMRMLSEDPVALSWIKQQALIGAPALGDCDDDGDVDSTDFAGLSVCFGGPEGGVAAGCGCFDLNADTAVDMLDFASFQRVFGQ